MDGWKYILKTDKFWLCFPQEAPLLYTSERAWVCMRRRGERLMYFLSGAETHANVLAAAQVFWQPESVQLTTDFYTWNKREQLMSI